MSAFLVEGVQRPGRSWVFAVIALVVVQLLALAAPASARISTGRIGAAANGDLTGTVVDSATREPLPGAEVIVRQNANVVARTNTDPFGRFVVHNLATGTYQVEIRFLGFHPFQTGIEIPATGGATLAVAMRSAPIELQSIEVQAPVPVAVDTRTGDQVFKQDEYHGAPTNTTSQIIQQSIAGAARAPTGEVHIRGQHAEYTYYVDGVPVPAGISGSLNELFDPAVVNEIDFQTGGWDAEYGDKNTAIINVTTKIPAGGFHADLGSYLGNYTTNGQSISASTNAGKWGFFASGARQETDMRQEPVVFDTATGSPINFHNHGQDLFTFGKVQYLASPRDVVNLDVNWSRTRFEVPYDSTGAVYLNDHQQDVNSFENLSWRHHSSDDVGRGSELFVGLFHRNGSLNYTPGAGDSAQFIFYPDTTTPYNLSESRSFNTTGLKLDYTYSFSEHTQIKMGTLSSLTRGHEDFESRDQSGNPGPASNSGLSGGDLGVYAQTVLGLSEQWELRTGVRYDLHEAPFAPNEDQVSPRVRLSFFPDPANTFWIYYGRLFIPTNVEDLRAITSVAQAGVATVPTLPERDHFFEIGYVHRFPFGVVAKLSGYHKYSSPGIDDNTVPGSAITTSVNISHVWITGLEAVLEVRPGGPVSGYLNFALNHAYGHGPVTGGFFPTDNPAGYFDLDHDQRISALATINYAPKRLFLSATGIYGTGLTNGQSPDASYGTGLFDFNRSIHVTPSFIMDASAGYTIDFPGVSLRPQLYVDNVFNHQYLLKGAFFSGASVGRPRTFQARLNLGF